jgi:hypothetical protein
VATALTRPPRPNARDLRVATGLRQLRLLTARQVGELWFPDHAPHAGGTGHYTVSDKVLSCLSRLTKAGLTARVSVRGTNAHAWYLTRLGWEQTRGEADGRPYRLLPEKADGNAQLHTLAVNDVGLAFVRAARLREDQCGPLDIVHEVGHPIAADRSSRRTRLVTPDALIRYEWWDTATTDGFTCQRTEIIRWFVELERDKKTLDRLMRKLEDYHALAHYARPGQDHPAWTEKYPGYPEPLLPEVLLVIQGWPDRTSEGRLRSVLTEARTRPILRLEDPPIWFTTAEDLREMGPFAPIWRTAKDDERRSIA